jgi:hypothetical protein
MLPHHIRFYVLIKPTNLRNAAEIQPGSRIEGSTMSDTSAGGHQDAGRYEIRLKGHLDSRWAAWFDGLSLTNDSNGTTIISGLVADQAALHGLLQKVRDVGLPLLSVTQTEPDQPDMPTIEPR